MTAAAGAYLLSMVRNRIALFFTLAFPLLFIVLFGLMFDAGGQMHRLAVGALDWGVANTAMFGVAYADSAVSAGRTRLGRPGQQPRR
jgi:ABC-2 type transport system permease protein